ncbi:MAG: hypothetical protein ACXWZM_04960 [Solirubrobacterales bacterium]
MSAPEQDRRGGASEALRSAIERTFAATAGSAAETRERAGELLDDVARRGQDARDEVTRRGQEARDEVTRRGQEAREAPRALIARVGDAVQRLRGVDVEAMRREIESLRKRVAELEQADKSKSKIKG